ncbi:MAG: trigger factor [Gammaproteobacteria bacterium]
MQVTVETSADNSLERKLRIQVPAERVEGAVSERLKAMSRRAKLKGFRPGKAPLKVIEQQYGPQIRQEVLGDLISSSYTEALVQHKFQPAGQPRINDTKAEPGEALEYTATIELYPEIELKPLDKLTITRPVVEIEVADVDKVLESLRKQRATHQPVDRAAADGDRLMVDFEGTLDGESFQGGTGKKVPLVLGEGRFLPGFESNLVGATSGDERTFDLDFPDDYPNKELVGKTAQFTVKVIEVAAEQLPEIDDEFCAAFGIADGGPDALRDAVKGNMQRELDQAVRRRMKQQALDGLVDLHDFTLPTALLEDELNRLKNEALERMGAAVKQQQPDLPDALFEETAKRRVKLGLLLRETIRVNELKLDRQRVHATIEDIAQGYGDPQRVRDAYAQNPRLMEGVEAMAMEEQVVDLILEKANITDKPAKFDELMNPNKNED